MHPCERIPGVILDEYGEVDLLNQAVDNLGGFLSGYVLARAEGSIPDVDSTINSFEAILPMYRRAGNTKEPTPNLLLKEYDKYYHITVASIILSLLAVDREKTEPELAQAATLMREELEDNLGQSLELVKIKHD